MRDRPAQPCRIRRAGRSGAGMAGRLSAEGRSMAGPTLSEVSKKLLTLERLLYEMAARIAVLEKRMNEREKRHDRHLHAPKIRRLQRDRDTVSGIREAGDDAQHRRRPRVLSQGVPAEDLGT